MSTKYAKFGRESHYFSAFVLFVSFVVKSNQHTSRNDESCSVISTLI